MSDQLEVIGKTIPVALISDHCTATDDSDCPHIAMVDEIEINLKDDDDDDDDNVSWSNVDKDGIIVKDDLMDRSLTTEHAAIPIVRGGEEVTDSVDENTAVVSNAIEDIKDIVSNRNDDSRPALLDDNNASALIVNDSSAPALIDSDSSAPSHTSSASTPAPTAEIVKKDRYGFMITDRFHSSTDLNEPSVVEERKQKEIQRVKKWIYMKNKWKSHCWYVDKQRNSKITSPSPGTTEAVAGAVVKSSSGGTSAVLNKLTKSSKLKSRIRKGIPDVFRGTVL